MIWVVKFICGKFTGTYSKIFIHRFYKWMDLFIELYDIFLFDTGTIVDHFTPKEIIITNISLW